MDNDRFELFRLAVKGHLNASPFSLRYCDPSALETVRSILGPAALLPPPPKPKPKLDLSGLLAMAESFLKERQAYLAALAATMDAMLTAGAPADTDVAEARKEMLRNAWAQSGVEGATQLVSAIKKLGGA